METQKLLEEVKPEIKGIAKKVYAFAKEALLEAAKESKTPLDDMALNILIQAYEAKLLAKIEGI